MGRKGGVNSSLHSQHGPLNPLLKWFPPGKKTIRPRFRNKGDQAGEGSGSFLGLCYCGVAGDKLTFPGQLGQILTEDSGFSSPCGPLTPPLSRFLSPLCVYCNSNTLCLGNFLSYNDLLLLLFLIANMTCIYYNKFK